MKTYYAYLTDLFGGELNYSYVTKLKIQAKSKQGALIKISKAVGLNFRDALNRDIFHSTSRLTGLVFEYEEDIGDIKTYYKDAEQI